MDLDLEELFLSMENILVGIEGEKFDHNRWIYGAKDYRKLPVTIKALRLDCDVVVKTLEGDMIGKAGDWLIQGVNGEFYPCKDDIFNKTYEQA